MGYSLPMTSSLVSQSNEQQNRPTCRSSRHAPLRFAAQVKRQPLGQDYDNNTISNGGVKWETLGVLG